MIEEEKEAQGPSEKVGLKSQVIPSADVTWEQTWQETR